MNNNNEGATISCKTYVAAGAINIENIENVENLFPGNEEMIKAVLGAKKIMPKNEKFGRVVSSMVADGTIRCKKHFAAICKYVGEEMYKGIGYTAFIKLLSENCNIAPEMMPNENDLKADNITGYYPDWRMPDASANKLMLYLSYGKEFVKRMEEL